MYFLDALRYLCDGAVWCIVEGGGSVEIALAIVKADTGELALGNWVERDARSR